MYPLHLGALEMWPLLVLLIPALALLKKPCLTRERAGLCSVSSLGVRTRKTRYLIFNTFIQMFEEYFRALFSRKYYSICYRDVCDFFQHGNLPVCSSSNINKYSVFRCYGLNRTVFTQQYTQNECVLKPFLKTSPPTSRLSLKPPGARVLSIICVMYVNIKSFHSMHAKKPQKQLY